MMPHIPPDPLLSHVSLLLSESINGQPEVTVNGITEPSVVHALIGATSKPAGTAAGSR